MKKFFFSLDTVLAYKQQVLENLRGEHAVILMRIRECETQIEALENEHRDCRLEFNENKLQGMTINRIHTYEHYLDALGLKIKAKQEELEAWWVKEEEKKNQVVEAKKETSSLEKLREKKLEEYNKEVQKQEEQFIEEFVSTKSAMEKLNG